MIPKAQQRRMTAVEDNRLRTEKLSGCHRFNGSHALVTTVCDGGANQSPHQKSCSAGTPVRQIGTCSGTRCYPRPHRADDAEGR